MARSFPEIAIEWEAKKRRERIAQTWAQHQDAKRFLREHVVPRTPGLGVALADCRRSYRVERSKRLTDKHKLVSKSSCWKLPWCIPCTQATVHLRVRRAEGEFHRFTPTGQKVRTMHAVFMAPLTKDGQGWGAKAMHDLSKFLRVVIRTLEDVFGKGIAGWASYQDFGEQPFTKSAPHWDLTLNGWRLLDGKIVPVEGIDFENGGKEILNAAYDARATMFGLDARPGNSWAGAVKEGITAARGGLAYQMRELVDVRKIDYVEGATMVGWKSYREDGQTDWATPLRFLKWYDEYHARVRPDESNRVHRAFGYMAGRTASKAAKQGFSGDLPDHEDGCVCRDCDDWERVIDASILYPAIEPRLAAFGI